MLDKTNEKDSNREREQIDLESDASSVKHTNAIIVEDSQNNISSAAVVVPTRKRPQFKKIDELSSEEELIEAIEKMEDEIQVLTVACDSLASDLIKIKVLAHRYDITVPMDEMKQELNNILTSLRTPKDDDEESPQTPVTPSRKKSVRFVETPATFEIQEERIDPQGVAEEDDEFEHLEVSLVDSAEIGSLDELPDIEVYEDLLEERMDHTHRSKSFLEREKEQEEREQLKQKHSLLSDPVKQLILTPSNRKVSVMLADISKERSTSIFDMDTVEKKLKQAMVEELKEKLPRTQSPDDQKTSDTNSSTITPTNSISSTPITPSSTQTPFTPSTPVTTGETPTYPDSTVSSSSSEKPKQVIQLIKPLPQPEPLFTQPTIVQVNQTLNQPDTTQPSQPTQAAEQNQPVEQTETIQISPTTPSVQQTTQQPTVTQLTEAPQRKPLATPDKLEQLVKGEILYKFSNNSWSRKNKRFVWVYPTLKTMHWCKGTKKGKNFREASIAGAEPGPTDLPKKKIASEDANKFMTISTNKGKKIYLMASTIESRDRWVQNLQALIASS